MSSPTLPPTVGLLTKEKQKSEDPEDGKMRTVLWAEQAALPDQQTFCKLSLERAVWLCLCYGELNNSALWCLQRKGFLDLTTSRPVVAPFSAGEPLGEPSLLGSSSAPALKQRDKRVSRKH